MHLPYDREVQSSLEDIRNKMNQPCHGKLLHLNMMQQRSHQCWWNKWDPDGCLMRVDWTEERERRIIKLWSCRKLVQTSRMEAESDDWKIDFNLTTVNWNFIHSTVMRKMMKERIGCKDSRYRYLRWECEKRSEKEVDECEIFGKRRQRGRVVKDLWEHEIKNLQAFLKKRYTRVRKMYEMILTVQPFTQTQENEPWELTQVAPFSHWLFKHSSTSSWQ